MNGCHYIGGLDNEVQDTICASSGIFAYFILTMYFLKMFSLFFFFYIVNDLLLCDGSFMSCCVLLLWLYEVSTFENLSELCEILSAAKSWPQTR